MAAADELSRDDAAVIQKASQAVIESCLSELGFGSVSLPASSGRGTGSLRYPTAEELSGEGYNWLVPAPSEEAELGPEVQEALDTVCGPRAGELVGTLAWSIAVSDYSELQGQVSNETFTTEQFRSALSEWSACMSSSGYSYSDPNEAYEFAIGLGALAPDSIALATADYGCRRSVRLLERRIEISNLLWSEALERNPDLPDEIARANRDYVNQALGVLADIGD